MGMRKPLHFETTTNLPELDLLSSPNSTTILAKQEDCGLEWKIFLALSVLPHTARL
jgi:hypothetical protein